MKSDLRISLIQTNLVWETPSANHSELSKKIKSLEETDIIVLPETFNTGFSMDSARLAETMSGPTIQWMQAEAQKANAVICGSLIIEEAGNYYNRFIWMKPDGTFEYYNKRHLFRMGNEHKSFTQGTEKKIIEYKGWKICPMICYDLRFPVWSRNQAQEYDVLIYVANWPEVRINAWETLLYARAIENQCYVAACNRIGVDGLGVNCSGSSLIINPKGETLWKAKNQKDDSGSAILSMPELQEFRQKFPVGLDGDRFDVL